MALWEEAIISALKYLQGRQLCWGQGIQAGLVHFRGVEALFDADRGCLRQCGRRHGQGQDGAEDQPVRHAVSPIEGQVGRVAAAGEHNMLSASDFSNVSVAVGPWFQAPNPNP